MSVWRSGDRGTRWSANLPPLLDCGRISVKVCRGTEPHRALDLIGWELSPRWRVYLKNQFGWIQKEKLHWISIQIDLHSNLFPKGAFLRFGLYIDTKGRINICFSCSHDREPFRRSSKLFGVVCLFVFFNQNNSCTRCKKIKSYFKAYTKKHQLPLLLLPMLYPSAYISSQLLYT